MKNKVYCAPCKSGGVKCKWIFTLIAVLCFVAAFSGKAMAAGEKPYFVYSSDGSTITFKWGTDYASGTQLNNTGDNFPYDRTLSVTTYPEVTKIIFEPEFINYKPTALCFAGYTGLKEIEGIEYLNTENYTSFFRMFYNCSSLENLDLSSFNTAKLEYMDEMFNGCTSLKTVKLNGPNFNTSNVKKMNIMFAYCTSLTIVDLSGFDTQNVTDMSAMFQGCESLESIKFPTSMTTSKLNMIESMFRYCKSLKYLDMSGFGMMSKVNNFKNVFDGCESMVVLDISNIFTNVVFMYGIFDDCKSLTTILVRSDGFKIDYLNTSWDQNYSHTYFGNCNNIIGEQGTTFINASYQYARVDGGESAPGYFTTGNYKIFYELDGGTNDVNNPIDFDIHLASDITIKQPTKDGYDFIGWTGTLASGLSETVPETDVKIAAGSIGNRIYTAHWAKKPKLTFDTKGGSQVHVPIVASAGSDISSEVTPIINGTNVTTKNGYDFVKWDKEIPTTMPATDLTITALWTPTVYNINLNYDGGALPTGKSNPTTFTIETETFTLEKPEKTGYTFAGWHTGKTVDPDGVITKGYYAQDLDYTATWDVNQYTITFNTDGGSAVAAITQDYNSAITAPANPTKEHYKFIGWDKAIPATMPAENITLTAQWEPIEYKITLDYAGGELPSGKSNPTTYTIETPTFTLEKPIRTGYTFAGWNTGKTVDPDGIIVKGTFDDIALTATWQINQYTITFNTDGADPIEAITQYYNTAITAPANPAKKGFTFLGWQPALPATMLAQDLTVKAQWRDDRETIAVDFNGTTSFPTDADKFCNGNETSISLPFTITKGQPSEYIVTFVNGTVVNGKVDANNNVLIEIPNDLESGVYKGSVVFNGDPDLYKESDAYPVAITANIPKNAALQIYSDVLLVDNHDNNYSAYQWYKDGNAISGATLQFYSEPSFSGRYTVKITDKDGKEFMSCPIKTGVSVKNTKSSVKVYPNPATSGEQFTLKIEEYDPAKDYTIMIFTANGTLVKKLTGLEKINTTTLPGGIYSGSLISNGEKSGFKVIVK